MVPDDGLGVACCAATRRESLHVDGMAKAAARRPFLSHVKHEHLKPLQIVDADRCRLRRSTLQQLRLCMASEPQVEGRNK